MTALGVKGTGYGQLDAPNSLAIDQAATSTSRTLRSTVEKIFPDGTFLAELKGPSPGFYKRRRIAMGPDNSIYVVDQGHARIARLSADGHVLAAWGTEGTADGQFDDPTSVAVDPTTNKVYVADPRNRRIQVFDANGKFLEKWSVSEWGQPAGFEDLAIDSKLGRLYASSTHVDNVLVFDLKGTRSNSLTPKPPGKPQGPSALALANQKLYVLDVEGSRVSEIDL